MSACELQHVLRAVAAHEGAAVAGVLIEGYLTGITSALVEIAGPEAAYNVLQRHADSAAAHVLVREARD